MSRYLTDLLWRVHDEGALRDGLDPGLDARWLIVVWDGLQLQWLYTPDIVNFSRHLEAHVRGLLAEQV